jgi:hypothetical protein
MFHEVNGGPDYCFQIKQMNDKMETKDDLVRNINRLSGIAGLEV